MVGGVMSGYCATGSENSATLPARVTMIDSTEAKIGWSMKKRVNMVVSGRVRGLRAAESFRRGPRRVARGPPQRPHELHLEHVKAGGAGRDHPRVRERWSFRHAVHDGEEDRRQEDAEHRDAQHPAQHRDA